jgi:CRISPR-associated endonuclease Csn1
MTNKALCERKINEEKGGETAFSYFKNKGLEVLEQYLKRVDHLYKMGLNGNSFEGIGKRKRDYLLMANEDIPTDFINRQLQETRYITRKASELLIEVTRKLSYTTGSVTKRLREDWGLVDVLKELNWEKYSQVEGRTEVIKGKNGEHLRRIIDWDKRNDHRHHAMDAITVALTKPAYVQLFNNLNAKNQNSNQFALKNKYLINGKLAAPFEGIRSRSLEVLGSILISHKSKNKVTTPNINRIQTSKGKLVVTANQSVPRGQLHKETVYGKSKQYECKYIKLGAATTLEEINAISNQNQRAAVLNRLAQFDGDIAEAFSGKNALKKNPIFMDIENKFPLPDKIKITQFTDIYSIRKAVGPDLKLEKVMDVGVRRKLDEHRLIHGKDAFTNLVENPVWLNKEKGISIKSVAISGVSNATPLHFKRDQFGNFLFDERGMKIPNDYVSLGNNHHVAIFRDENGNLQEEVVSFYEAVRRKNSGEPLVQKEHPLGWEFFFTLKQNDMFVIPQPDFDPSEIDFQNPANQSLIGRNLYRVQKIASKDYWFRHHLETTVTNDIKNLTFYRIGPNYLKGFIKCRLNHLGKIIDWDIRD